jgi:hypothetical protein
VGKNLFNDVRKSCSVKKIRNAKLKSLAIQKSLDLLGKTDVKLGLSKISNVDIIPV